ncbi:MOSC domain-containing protein [Dyadobacter bucti]|uniref:MOSC domain-containing protein n=1 Tax=Dyadobacter bucti TaxID=2572203 RepID=UPI0011099EEE|nr:MOSC N-terminal beta barrel domain-containing protein [Dyadobacter bucti]
MVLSEIWIYPVKSLGGIRLNASEVEEKGLKFDRRWMIVDEDGVFLTQRVFSKMALLDISLLENGLVISSRFEPGNEVFVPYTPVSGANIEVKVWDDIVQAVTVSDEADAWLSKQLDKNVRIVMMPESTRRPADPRYALHGEAVSFADGFPFLLISQGSLDDLNSRLPEAIEMRRFRPNFVVTGTGPFSEDAWKSIRIGSLSFDVVKPCARCVLTTIDPKTGEKGAEPLKTLASFRRVNNKILFGQNLVGRGTGTVCEGDEITLV